MKSERRMNNTVVVGNRCCWLLLPIRVSGHIGRGIEGWDYVSVCLEVFSTDTACYWSPDTFAVLCCTRQCSEEHTPHGKLKRAFIPQRSVSSKLQPDSSSFTTLHHHALGRDGLQHSLNIGLSRFISQHKIIGLYDNINVDFLAV